MMQGRSPGGGGILWTALHLACAQGHKELAVFLISSKAKLNLCDNDQRSPLMKGAQGNHIRCVETLLKNNADPNLVDKDGNTALHLGAHGGFVDVVLLLLKGGAMVNAPNKNGSTSLHLCTDAKQDVMVEVLLDNDADVNATDNTNRTALMLASQSDQIGLVKLLLDRKADTEIKDSKGWTANDHAIMGGFHGCSHLIDEFNSNRRPRGAVVRPGSSMFGSTAGSEGIGLGFSLGGGGGAADEYDDEEDDISVGKDSFGDDSWGASASEADEPIKPKPKVSKAVKLSKFVVESDNESILSFDASQRSTASKSRIPRAVSKDSLASASSARSSARTNQDSSKIPRKSKLGDPTPDTKLTPAKQAKVRGHSVSETDPWDSPTPTPRDSAPPVNSYTPRGPPLSARSSVISVGESGSEWDDDDVLGALEGIPSQKMPNISEEKNDHQITAKRNDEVEKRPLSSQDKQQRKDVLNKLGMSDVEDDEEDSSLHFTDSEVEKDSTVKRGLQNPIIKANSNPLSSKEPKGNEEEDSDWDSDDDLLPSNTSNHTGDVAAKKPVDLRIQTNSDSLASKTKPTPSAVMSSPRSPVPGVSPRIERKLPSLPNQENKEQAGGLSGRSGESPKTDTGTKEEDEPEVEEEEGGGDGKEEEEDDDWDSEDDDVEEESEWEKARKLQRRASVHEELKQAEKTEAQRQKLWEAEEAEREKQRKIEVEAELRREQEEIEKEQREREEAEKKDREREKRERKEREQKEEEQRREERKKHEALKQEAERLKAEQREREEAEQRRRDEEKRADDERKHKIEEERLERKKQEKMEEEKRLRANRELEAEEQRLEEELRKEMAEMKTVEEKNEAERLFLERERKRLEEERQKEEMRRDEEKRLLETEMRREQERIEEERVKLQDERRAQEKRLEDERKKVEDAQKRAEDAQKKAEDSQKKVEDAQKVEKQILEREMKRQAEEMKQKLENQEQELKQKLKRQEEERKKIEKDKDELNTLRRKQEETRLKMDEERRREEDKRKWEEDSLRKKEEHLESERKKIEEETKKRQRELLKGISSQNETEKKQFEDELRRLDEERERREDEFVEEKMKQTAEKTSLQREIERLKEDRLKLEAKQQEAEKQRQLMESQREEEVLRMTQELTREKEQRKAEKLRLEKENEEIERKRREIETMKRDAEKKESERYLQRYQKSIEKRLQDEDGSDVQTADGDHSTDIDADLHEMEVAVIQKQRQDLQGTSPVLSGSRANINANNGLDSQGNTTEFNQGLYGQNPRNPLHSTAVLRSQKSPISHNPLTNGNPHGLLSLQPSWQAVLSEPDGLDASSTDEDNDDDATTEELRASFLTPYLSSTPITLNTNQNAGGTAQIEGATDPTVLLRLQGQLREQKRIADREKGLRHNAENHCQALEGDIEDMHRKLEESSHIKAALDQHLLDLEARIRTLEHEMSQEVEKRNNAEVLLDKTKEQLIRKEDLYAHEIEAKQKAELGARNLSLEVRTAQNLVRQLEEERDEFRSQLLHEKHARALQEEMVQDQLHAQDVLHQETSRFFTEKAEAVTRLEAADESRRVVLNQSDRLKTELHALKVELERQRMRHRDDQGMLTSENEELANKIDELKSEIRVSEEALAHATMAFNSQLMAVKTENAMLHGAVEKEMNKSDKLQTKLDSVDRRLKSTSQELEKAQQARADLERSLQRERDEWSLNRDKLGAEIISLRDSSQATIKKYTTAESRLRSLEKELQVASTSLMERSNQLASLQRDLDSRNTRQNSNDTLLQREKEDNYKISARMEGMVERLNDAQNEIAKLRRSLDTTQQEKIHRDKEMMDAQEKFSSTLKTLQAENERTRTLWEERMSTSSENVSRLKEELQRSEHNRSIRDQEIRQIQQELTEALRKLSISEANLELARKNKNELDKEKQHQGHHMKQLQDQITSMERDRRSLEARIEEIQNDLMQTQRNNLNTSQQLMVTQTSLQRKSELEERLRDLETENAKMEMAVNNEKAQKESLQREIRESNKMRAGLEGLVSTLQTNSMHIEDKLQEETANRSLFAKEAEDHRGLWELEVKSRSRLGLRIAQLERAKAEVQAQVDEEKKKVRKMAEMKRSYEERWQNEVQRTQQQEQENGILKAKLKAAKKKLKDLEAPEVRFNSLQTGFERERLNMDATVATQRIQLDDLNQQLERESAMRAETEMKNRQLHQELSSAKTVEKGKDKLERSKRKLEEELTQMKVLVQQNFVEKGELEKYKQQLDTKARLEVNEKLDQVNAYLEEQSQARDKLEMLRNSNESELRKEQENTINDLKNEMSRLRSSYHDILAQKETMEVEVTRFKELYQDAVQKQDKMSAQQEKTQDKLVDLQAKFTIQKQRNRQMLDGSLDITPGRHLSKKPTQGPQIDSITEKVWSELDKSITRHLQAAPTDVGASLAELRAGSLSRSYDGYNSPLRQENNQYLATLRKNYFV
ncbi:uncharacterized protein [Asterias amurensis]|uniref:uncharacterized protein isoform X2 n=1 Tax=Asterias amurensis TaxID=7602 RepID=UPI003AB45838